jgi:hypothetical protein
VQKIFAVIILSSFLAACGSSDESVSENLSNSSGPSLAEISGVWDASVKYGNQSIDERYLVVYSDGFIRKFNYKGDSYDLGENCFEATIDKLFDYGFGDFEVTSELEGKFFIKVELSENELIITDEDEIPKIYPESMLEVSYLEDEDTLCK